MSYKSQNKTKLMSAEEGYDLYSECYDESLAFLNSFERDEIFRMLGDVEGKKVLDVGAGTGRSVEFLRKFGAEVTAVDLSEKMLDVLRKKFPRVEAVVGDIEDLPLEDEVFDVVLCSFVIVHLDGLQEAFDEVYRVLKPGGMFIVTNINQRKPPKLELKDRKKIVIKSFYHRPQNVLKAVEDSFFKVEEEKMILNDGVWINQIIKARK